MSNNLVLLERKAEIGIIYINRPKALNALNSEVLKEIDNMLDKIMENDDIKVVIITGKGKKAFVGGADIAEMKNYNSLEAHEFVRKGQKVFLRIENYNKPVIAAINGFALGGGCELSLACDLRVASKEAVFGQPEVGLGIIPGFGGTQRLPRIVGLTKAKEMIYTGKNIDAEEAKRIGLVNEVVENGDVLDKAKEIAKDITKNSQIAVNSAKDAIQQGMQMDINSANSYEANKISICFSTEDQKEGMEAFLQNRKPKFSQ